MAQGHWSFLGPGSEKKWYGTHVHKPDGEWDEVAEIMMINFSERKAKGRSTIHFNCSVGTIEVILRTDISVNQLSIYGAVADVNTSRDSQIFQNRPN